MSKSSKFIKNTLILSIGTVGAKMVQYLLLPYYTHILNTAEYGTVDNLQNIAILLIPIVSMTVSEAIFRYAMDKNYDRKMVFTNGTLISGIGTFIAVVITMLIASYVSSQTIREYMYVVLLYIATNVFRTNCSLYVKAVDKTVLYTVDNILLTFVTVISNILFLSVMEWGVMGYMLGYVVGNLFSLCFLILAVKLYNCFSFKLFSKDICKMLLVFCVPLIPNTICWWISNCSDRFMITYYMGQSANGIYAIAYKIPTIMTIIIGVLLQAWQISANEASEDKKISNYYTQIYKFLDAFVLILGCILILMSKLVIGIMAADAYFEAWRYVPSLVYAICFFAHAQLLGTIYTTFRSTTMAFVSNLIAAVINILGNIILINLMGVIGAAIATAISYIVLFYVRKWDTKKYVHIENASVKETISRILLLVEAIVYTCFQEYIWGAYVCMIMIIILQYNVLRQLICKMFSLVRK